MEYVEILRARRVLTWYCGLVFAAFVIGVVSLLSGHVNMHAGANGDSPLSALIQGSAFAALIVATCMAPGLNAESSTLAITWTRPMPRDTIAWRYVAVDVAAILFAWLFAMAIALAFLATFGLLGTISVDGGVGGAILNGLGCALMWYGLVALVSARLNGRGTLIAGLSWAVFIVLSVLWVAPFPTPLHGLITFLDYFNPLTYFHNIGEPTRASRQVLPVAPEIQTLIAWGFVVVTFVASVRLWSTREV